MINRILKIIKHSDKPLSAKEIRSIIFKETKNDMAQGAMNLYLTKLMSTNLVKRKKKSRPTVNMAGFNGRTQYYEYEAV